MRAGSAAVHYLLRVAVGLDSVAEGEGAVGRQVLKAFEHARSTGVSDGRLHRVWKHVERAHSRAAGRGARARAAWACSRWCARCCTSTR